jgi:hypothetical protein
LSVLWVVTALGLGLAACSDSSDRKTTATTVQRHGVVVCRAVPDGVAIPMPKFVDHDVLSAAQLACDVGIKIIWAKEPMRMDRIVRTQDPKAGTATVTGGTVRLTSVLPRD